MYSTKMYSTQSTTADMEENLFADKSGKKDGHQSQLVPFLQWL